MAAGRRILRVQCRAGSGPANCRHCQANPCQAGRGGGAKKAKDAKSKHYCAWTWVCLVWTSVAADFQLSGGPAGRVQQETNQLVRLQACIYWNIPWYTFNKHPYTPFMMVYTCIYFPGTSYTVIYRHIPSYTVIYSDIPQTCIYTFMLSTKNISVYIPPIWSDIMMHIGSWQLG